MFISLCDPYEKDWLAISLEFLNPGKKDELQIQLRLLVYVDGTL
jgi:hypothetical protein